MLSLAPVDSGDPELRAALLAAALPVDDLDEPGRQFFRLDDGAGPVGYGGLEVLGADALLRSVVVLPERRGRGVGRALVERLLERAAAAGVHHAYLLTTDAAAYFGRLGFMPLDRADAPAGILATRQATTLCTSAALLGRALT